VDGLANLVDLLAVSLGNQHLGGSLVGGKMLKGSGIDGRGVLGTLNLAGARTLSRSGIAMN
jgi:hypothetical protein